MSRYLPHRAAGLIDPSRMAMAGHSAGGAAAIAALLDQHLRGEPQALLDQPSPHYPEVTFCSPTG